MTQLDPVSYGHGIGDLGIATMPNGGVWIVERNANAVVSVTVDDKVVR